MSKYFINTLLLLLFSLCVQAQVANDDEDDQDNKTVVVDSVRQLRFGFDVFKPILYGFDKQRKAFDFELDYYYKKESYWVLEGGWGSGQQDSLYLSYKSSNVFFRGGYNKGILTRLFPNDWDMAFIGLRYGLAFIDRSPATFTIIDPIWGNTSGTIPGKNIFAHWFEITGGVRVELFKGLFTGWTVRGKFIFNGKQLKELPPSYIAGYGRGDKPSIFDFNFYVDYAIRWKKKKVH